MEVTNLSPKWFDEYNDISCLAAELAPAIRILGKRADRFPFTRYEKNITSNCISENNLSEAGELLSISTEGTHSTEDILEKIKEKKAELGKASGISINGIGNFFWSFPETTVKKPRLDGKIAVVTGGAQGFGEGIARELAAVGAHVVIVDLNETLAKTVANSLNQSYGPATASSFPVDVGNEESVMTLMNTIALQLGGFDLLISNAGVLRAGGLEEMTLQSFEFVTKINYTAFFLITKYGSQILKRQTKADENYTGDIIQINSKSGLEGSNKNFAYAGGKFGGIGLVQSFAKELVTDRIKVNAICPGNYYEGPLWSDPEKGLFIQYLQAGKVPGAKTVEDVYESYISKVPMRRGCSPLDVTRAILYCCEQQYETGQAIPVTGGQNMLK